MRRAIIWGLLLCALGCFALAILAFRVDHVDAQDDAQTADYIGSGDCRDCHRNLARDHTNTPHANALQEGDKKDAILGDFSQGEDIRMVQFPGEDAPRPFTKDDIAYVVGAGRYIQRYLYEVGRREWAVLPAEWNVTTGTWQPYKLADVWPAPEYDFVQNCAGCHTTGLNIERSRWEDEGVWCEACHGPGSIHAELADDAGSHPSDKERAEIHAAIVLSPDAQVCGQCHSQGSNPDGTHPFPTDYRPGGTLLDDSVFQLPAKNDPTFWYETGHGRLNNMQFNEWLKSAHAGSLPTMTDSPNAQDGCVTCHSGDYTFTERLRGIYADGDLEGDPPESTTLATAQFSITCTTCHSPHTAVDTEFNLVSAPNDLCTTCHRNTDLVQPVHHPVMEMFEGQTMVDGIEGVPSAHYAAEGGPQCVTCHMQEVPIGGAMLASHTWRPVIPGEAADSPPDACSSCHEDLTTTDLQSLVEDTQSTVRSRLTLALARLGSITKPEAGSAMSAQYDRVVAALSFVQNDGSMGVHNYAYVDKLLNDASVNLAELSVPGAQLQPTEGPAPTATPSQLQPIVVAPEMPAHTGFRPMTFILIGAAALILLAGSLVIVRQARRRTHMQETTP